MTCGVGINDDDDDNCVDDDYDDDYIGGEVTNLQE